MTSLAAFQKNDGPWTQTFTGRRFHYLVPTADMVDVRDVAHALSMVCRFAGHVHTFYSVAEHSVRVSFACDPEDALAGLLHDAPEAYIVDLPSPVKALLPEYQTLERKVWGAVASKFGLPEQLPPSVKRADGVLLVTEARDLMSPGWETWCLPHSPLRERIEPWTQVEAEALFLSRYYELAVDALGLAGP